MAAKNNNPAELHKGKFLIRLPKDKYHYEDVPVSVNGKTTLIKRGVNVWVSAAVKEVLEHSEEMESRAFERMAKAEEEYESGKSAIE